MADLNESLEIYLNKALKVAKSVDKFINGTEKQLVIEVGSHTTKIVEYIVKQNVIEVIGGAVVTTPVNAVKNDRLVDTSVLANVLKQTIKAEKIKSKEAVISIVSKEIITREMNVPQMNSNDLKNFVEINSNDIFPVKLSNYVLGYNIIDKGQTNRVMIAAIPKDIVKPYLELGKKLGLYFKGVNYSGYELYNFLDYEINDNKESYMAVDIGARNTNIIIISKGSLKFNKTLPKGSEEVSSNICEELNCTLIRAEQLKRQYNTILETEDLAQNTEKNAVVNYTRRCLDSISTDIIRIMEFFNSNNPKNKISTIYLIGTVGKINGIEKYFNEKLNVEIKPLKKLEKVEFNKHAVKLNGKGQNLINCLGASSLKDREFNLIKGDLNFKKLSIVLKPKFHKAAACVLLIMVGVLLLKNNSLTTMENTMRGYEEYIEANSELVSLNRMVSGKRAEVNSRKTLIDSLGIGFENYTNILDSVDEAIRKLNTDATVNVTRYKFAKDKIEIKGRVELPEGVDQTSEDYFKYKNLPFDIKDEIGANLQNEIKVTSNTTGVASIDFTLEIGI